MKQHVKIICDSSRKCVDVWTNSKRTEQKIFSSSRKARIYTEEQIAHYISLNYKVDVYYM